jgi:hypothetical protein
MFLFSATVFRKSTGNLKHFQVDSGDEALSNRINDVSAVSPIFYCPIRRLRCGHVLKISYVFQSEGELPVSGKASKPRT